MSRVKMLLACSDGFVCVEMHGAWTVVELRQGHAARVASRETQHPANVYTDQTST